MRDLFFEKDPEKKKELAQKFLSEKLAPQLLLVEKRLETNGGAYLVGKDVSLLPIPTKYLSFKGSCSFAADLG